ncbi:MAG: 4-hydroxybenzoate octaprenyltransferase [Phycisphaera sp.]|nr:4-hydroxybenzoate octaprenyltransferase [Phycisphaera sp.]
MAKRRDGYPSALTRCQVTAVIICPVQTLSKLTLLAGDIKLSHSVFALPFALLAAFIAAAGDGSPAGKPPGILPGVLIVVCMVLARTVAMSVNRWADARLDADNPRTRGRAIPSGRLSRSYVLTVALVCAGLFIVAASGFWILDDNPWPVLLSPLVLVWLCLYSFTKRFTWLCHLFLGTALAISPLAAGLAIRPESLARPDLYLLFVMVASWVAGFDIIYALQDVEIDRASGLWSMPSRLGVEPALWVGRLLHLISLAALVTLVQVSPTLGYLFAVGVGLVACLLVLEHALVWGSRTYHIPMAFFTVNGLISLLLGGLGIADVVMHVSRG